MNDGATAEFSWPGVPEVTYVNYGCQAPIIPVGVEADVVGDLCGGGTVTVTGTVTGTYETLTWSGGTGTFADPTALSTTYTAGPGRDRRCGSTAVHHRGVQRTAVHHRYRACR